MIFNSIYIYTTSFLLSYLFFFFCIFFISLLLGLGFYIISLMTHELRKDGTVVTFECGFDPGSDVIARPILIVRGIVIGIVFLVFDLEILLLLPFLIVGVSAFNFIYSYCFIVLVWTLAFTFFIEFYYQIFMYE